MKTILVPVDLSAATARVCAAAGTLAKLLGARLVLLHVVQPQPIFAGDLYAWDAGAVAAALEAEQRLAARKLRSLVHRWSSRGLPAESLQAIGTPEAEILAQAVALEADYIVVGTHGHGVAYDLLIGSAVQGVLRKARCPVLVVPVKSR